MNIYEEKYIKFLDMPRTDETTDYLIDNSPIFQWAITFGRVYV